MDQKIRDAALALSPEKHAEIFRQLLKLQEGQGVVFASSDLHEDGITSLFSEVRELIEGAVALSDVVLFPGTDSEYESNAEVIRRVKEIEKGFKEDKSGTRRTREEKHEILITAVEEILSRKAESDVAWRKKLAEENPETTFVEVGGNHSNCTPFREAMALLSGPNGCKNYYYSNELGGIRLGKNKDSGLVTITHSHQQLTTQDAGMVAPGSTDQQMGFLTLRQMAEKAIKIARTEINADTTMEWATRKLYRLKPDLSPSGISRYISDFWNDPWRTIKAKMAKAVEVVYTPQAQKQEALQWLVDWLRKPVSTFRKIHRELGYRALLGSVLEQLNQPDPNEEGKIVGMKSLKDTKSLKEQLNKRIEKIKRKLKELPEEKELSRLERNGRKRAYKAEKKTLKWHLSRIDKVKALLEKDGANQEDLSWLEKEVQHIVIAGKKEPVLFTMEHFHQMKKLFSGHTHVPSIDILIDRETSRHVSKDEADNATGYTNTGSTTEMVLTGAYGKKASGKPVDIKLEKIGAAFAVYDLETGKMIGDVVSIGQLIAKNRSEYEALVAEKAGLEKPKEARSELERIHAEEVRMGLENFRARIEARTGAIEGIRENSSWGRQ